MKIKSKRIILLFILTLLVFITDCIPVVPVKFKPNLIIDALYYDYLKDKLTYGDVVYVTLVRANASEPLDESKFLFRINKLKAIDDSRIKKAVVFSSLEDLIKYIDELPGSVEWISYNTERKITPSSENLNILESIAKFSNIVHRHGKKMGWAPVVSLIDSLNENGILKEILPLLDSIGYQGQNILLSRGVKGFEENVEEKSQLFKRYNPDIKVKVQLVLRKNRKEDIVEGFRRIEDCIDYAVIFCYGNPQENVPILEEIITGLRGVYN
ncbi:MAG: hypothetical protein DRI22_03305 [Caldiserica bacterium]|nr:MAG: hypothetical protein DRI22_03305 [Caldisericota bacterium]